MCPGHVVFLEEPGLKQALVAQALHLKSAFGFKVGVWGHILEFKNSISLFTQAYWLFEGHDNPNKSSVKLSFSP